MLDTAEVKPASVAARETQVVSFIVGGDLEDILRLLPVARGMRERLIQSSAYNLL